MPYVTTFERFAKERGMKRGRRKAKLEIAKNLIKFGVAKNIIAESTGLPLEEIEKLAATHH